MTENQFDTLRAAVTVARNTDRRDVKTLRIRLTQAGHAAGDIDEAIQFWSAQLRRTKLEELPQPIDSLRA